MHYTVQDRWLELWNVTVFFYATWFPALAGLSTRHLTWQIFFFLVLDVLVVRLGIYGFIEHMHIFLIPYVQYIDKVAIHQAHWDTASLPCSLIAVCSSLRGLSIVSMLNGCMTALKLCTAATIMKHSTASCIYDSIKKLHKDNVVVCFGVPFILLPIPSVIRSDLWNHILKRSR